MINPSRYLTVTQHASLFLMTTVLEMADTAVVDGMKNMFGPTVKVSS